MIDENYITEKDLEEGELTKDTPKNKLSDKKIKQLALSFYKGEVFCSAQIKNPNEVSLVFMPLNFIDTIHAKVLFYENDNRPHFYEFLDKAGPRGVNGYPCFFSFRCINQEDLIKVIEERDKISAMLGEYEGDNNE